MISIDRLEEMALEDIENNPEKHLEEYTELLRQLDQLKAELEQEKNWHKISDEISKANSEYTAKLKAKNEELKRVNLHIENNREHKANKLNRIEKLILACTTGYTDEFIQELLVILHEPEPVSFENKYLQTLTEIKEIAEVLITTTDEYDSCYYKDKCSKCEVKKDCQYFKVEQILQKISEVEDETN